MTRSSREEVVAALRAVFATGAAEDAAAEQVYQALKATGRLKDQRLITYRCQLRGCLLLDVVQVPGRVIAHSPRYRLSPEVNALGSNEAGRAANTVDGDRRWKAHIYAAGSPVNFVLNCDHIHGVVIEKVDVESDIRAGRHAMAVTATGERHPLR